MITKGHYHCIECGSLFESSVKDTKEQRCPICGNPPTGKILAGTELDRGVVSVERAGYIKPHQPVKHHGVSQDAQKIQDATLASLSKQHRGRVKRTKRREKKSRTMWLVFGAWVAVLLGIALLVKKFSVEDKKPVARSVAEEEERVSVEAEAKKERLLVQAAIPECGKILTDFLNAPSPAAKAQFVYQGAKMSGMMTRYYRNNPSFSSTRSQIRITRGELLKIDGQKAMGTVCQNSLGERFEAIFISENDEWKIDWKSFVRYDAEIWSLFPTGADGNEADFRLYLRVRDTGEDIAKQTISVVFYKPGMYTKTDYQGQASSSVSVAIDSPMGKQIQGMLDSEGKEDQDAYGFTLSDLDPIGYHRVRVRLRLHKEEGKPAQMELVKILANHWYGEEVVAPAAE